MASEINELTQLAHEGSALPLTTTPVVGTPSRAYPDLLVPGAEPVGPEEIRVTVLGSGDPFVKKSQASASLLIEVGNPEQDFFFFDLGSGALANFDGLGLPGHRHHQGLPVPPPRRPRRRHAHAAVEPGEGRSPRPGGGVGPGRRGGPPRHPRLRPPPRGRPRLGHEVAVRAPRSVRGPGDHHRGALRPARGRVPAQRRDGHLVPGDPHPQRRGRLPPRLRRAQRRVLRRHPAVPVPGRGLRRRRPADPRDVPDRGGLLPEVGRAPGARRADRQRRPHQPGHGRHGLREGRRPDVGDVAPRGRPPDRRAGVLRGAGRPRRPRRDQPGPHRVRHQRRRGRRPPAHHRPASPGRSSGPRSCRARRCRRRSTRRRGGPTPCSPTDEGADGHGPRSSAAVGGGLDAPAGRGAPARVPRPHRHAGLRRASPSPPSPCR